jgi:hypothetical protein
MEAGVPVAQPAALNGRVGAAGGMKEIRVFRNAEMER